MTDSYYHNKRQIERLRSALYNNAASNSKSVLDEVLADDVDVHIAHPFGDLAGRDQYFNTCYLPLLNAWPDVERRDYIVISGDVQQDQSWVGCAGFYCGTFMRPWLDIPPTGHLTHMRFHEFYRFEDNKVVEIQAIWDIPEVMMQANAWPMAPSLGREGFIPGPATNDGVSKIQDNELSGKSCQLVIDMLDRLQKYPSQGGPEVMQMERYWHPKMNWYGPAGIGTSRGISGFRHWHQIPFLNAMPDRGQFIDDIEPLFFADGNYVAAFGWPNMRQTVSADGWMGIVPSDTRVDMRSLDFWRIENDLIRENWVLVDLLDIYRQLGVDVFARLREFNKARVNGVVQLPEQDY